MTQKMYGLDLILVVAGMPINADTIRSGKSIGGSETAGIQMAETLAAMDHKVTLFCNTEKPHEGVKNLFYKPLGYVPAPGGGAFPKGYFDYVRSTPHDVLIVQRLPAMLQFDVPSKVNFLWQHDLATKTGPSFYAHYVWNIDRIFVLSQFMKEQYKGVHGAIDELFHVTRNGIDLNLIDAVPSQERDRFRLTYTSRPERGLDILLTRVFPLILKKEPRASLYLSRYEDPASVPLYEQLAQLATQFGDRIVNMGNLGKTALYENYKKSRLLLYSSAFEEVSCITSQEQAACGSVMIGPWRGALPETCGDAAVLLKDDGVLGRSGDTVDPGFNGVSDAFVNAFADWTVRMMYDDILWQSYHKKAIARAREWTWDKVAEDWMRLAHDLISRRSDEPRRLLKHFLSTSDVVAAQKLAERETDNPHIATSVKRYIDRFVPFMNESDSDKRREAIRDFYEARSGGDAADYRTGFWADREPRLQVLLQWMKPKVDAGEIKTVLDFGCAHGGYARAISNAFPEVKVVGVDTSKSLIRCANEMKADQSCQHPENLEFQIADEETILANPQRHAEGCEREYFAPIFDLVVAMDVLEHLPNAEEVAKKLERHCKSDGWMLFTVPTGYRERDEFLTNGNQPVHVRSFDLHDLRDIFSHRKDYGVMSFSDYQETTFDRTFSGWWMILYRQDGQELGQIDWDRKLFLQGPRETLSVCMIVNNSEDVLHRALRSVVKYADQIIVVDNGPSFDRTTELASEYTDDVREGTSPFYCYSHGYIHSPDQINPDICKPAGFETPRNESIEGAWGDWILWLDSDENLLEPRNLVRYLRPNCLLGYPVRQHHIAVDPVGAIKTDLPARLIRNHQGIKCYGCLTPNMTVVTNPGLERIADIGIGDLVRTHDGTYRPVSKIWRYDVKDTMIRVIARGMPEPLELTRDHKVYAIRHDQCFYNYEQHAICKPPCEKRCPHRFYEHYSPDWVMAKDLRCGDILMYPVEKITQPVTHIQLSKHAQDGRRTGSGMNLSWKLDAGRWHRTVKSTTASMRDEIELTDGLLRLFGYYISDGHIAEGSKLKISFAEHEQEYALDAKNIATQLGLCSSIITKRKMATITIYGRPLCEWLIGEFGFGSRNKKAPLWIMRLPVEQQKAFLTGLWRGDGNVSGTLVRYTTANRLLANQVHDLLLRRGLMANVRYGRASKCFEVFARSQDEQFLDWQIPDMSRTRTRLTWTDGDYVYMPIKNIESFEYEGPIFDLTVEGNHSFVANHAIVSNCVHEHFELGINKGIGLAALPIPEVQQGGFAIHHDGYLTEQIRRKRFERNINLLKCDRIKYPDRLLGIYLYEIRDNMHLAQYEMERMQGMVNDKVRMHCQTVIDAYKKHFLNKNIFFDEDSLGYYSNALAMLGLGVEIAYDLDVKQRGAGPTGQVKRFRAADTEEARSIINARLEQLAAPWIGRYVA